MEDTDLPFSVPVKIFTEFFSCTICMTELKSTILTPCGHRYCQGCIEEWVGRSHSCPCCKKGIKKDDLILDREYNSLIDAVNKAKEVAEGNYLDRLINKVTKPDQENGVCSVSPVEEVLKRHLKQSLAAHGTYFQTLKREFKQKEAKLQEQTTRAVNDLTSHGLSDLELTHQTEDLLTTLEREKNRLHEEMAKCTHLVAEAFDKHLSNHIPTLDVLPVKVSISLLDKNIQIPDITVKPSQSIEDLIPMIEEAMEKRRDPIRHWSEEVRFVLFGPFAKCSSREMKQNVEDILRDGGTGNDIRFLLRESKPILQHGMKPGSEIAVYGCVMLHSDMPKQCFSQTFVKGKQTDYFSCRSCKFQWICSSCMEVCHKGHELVPYIMNHSPQWACCYCPKKNKCVIQKNKG